MKKIHLFLLFLVLAPASLFAQQTGTGYSSAVQLINSGRPAEAMEELRPYLDYQNYGKLSLYANYHFARAAYNNRQYQLAQATLVPLFEKNNWDKADDAHYLLAQVYFAQNEAFKGLSEIKKIENAQLQEEGYKASYDYLSKNAAISLLVANYPSFKENKGYSLALKEKLQQQSVLSTNEKKLLADLQEMDLSGNGNDGFSKVKNSSLDIAIVLPFNYQGGSGVRGLEGNNFVFELYQGIDMGIKAAKGRGVDINVKTFDTERKDAVVRKILSDPFFRQADVIIGPIYPEETALVAAFADQYEIPFINPLSNITANFGKAEFAYLFRPSTEVIVEQLLDYGRSHTTGDRIGLAYSGSSRDELMARQFAEQASKRGYRVVYNEKVSSNNIRNFLENAGLKPGMKAKVDQLVIFSDDPYIASPTLSILESLTSQTPVFVMDSWLYFNFANFDLLEGSNLNYIGNNTVNYEKEATIDFRNRFFEKYSLYPGANAYIGFDLVNWVATTVNARKGFGFRNNLDSEGYLDSGLSFGLDFRNSQSNQYVPILKLNEGKLEEVK